MLPIKADGRQAIGGELGARVTAHLKERIDSI
jgi:hypothetical protein